MTLSERLVEYVSACFTGIWIQSAEHEDALREIAQMCRDQDWKLASWDVDRGLQIPGSEQLEELARGIATEEGELPEGDALQTVFDAAAGLTRGFRLPVVARANLPKASATRPGVPR